MPYIHIESIHRDIELKPRTRAVSRAIEEALMQGVVTEMSDDGTAKKPIFPVINVSRSEEVAIRLLSGLTHDEMNNLTDEEYETLKKAVNSAFDKKKSEPSPETSGEVSATETVA